jgi:hypothetical protein
MWFVDCGSNWHVRFNIKTTKFGHYQIKQDQSIFVSFYGFDYCLAIRHNLGHKTRAF